MSDHASLIFPYIGTKLIKAYPEPAHHASGTHAVGAPGYHVIYEDGYESWSPKDVFEAAYRPASGMNFGLALEALKKGSKVARGSWSGKGMWLSLSGLGVREVPASAFWSDNNAQHAAEQGGSAKVLPCITAKTATGEILMGWLPPMLDMMAEDWQIVE